MATTAPDSPQLAGSHLATKPTNPNIVLAVCCLSMLLVGMDVTIVNVALPAIQRNLQASVSGLQWVLDAYTLVVASLLMLMGSISDRIGRRRVFQIGLILFTTGSLTCSIAPNAGALVAARSLQGLGASMLNPVALSIVANVFRDPRDRARAIGIWGAIAGLSMALGPLIGGALTQTVGWRSIFWINVPIGILAVFLAARYVPESKAAKARPLDPIGQLLVVVGLGCLIYGLIEGPNLGWTSPRLLGFFGTAALALLAFLIHEPRSREPLLDLRFFRSVNFSSAAVLALCAFSSFSSFLFLNALYLQQARGFAALQSGLCMLPLALMMMLFASLSGRLVATYGSRPSIVWAGIGMLASALLLARLDLSTPLPQLLLAYAMFGMALGLINPAVSNSAVAGMPLSQAGVSAAIASTCRQVGAAFGIAAAGTIVRESRARGMALPEATHPIWLAMLCSSVVVLILGWISGTSWVAAREKKVREQFEA